jgi:alkylation response protein AidB-like acyl-CoA dehydrogenase
MATQSHDTMGGRRFLTESVHSGDVFVREELSEEQKLFGQTAAEFMRKEVLPRVDRLYAHDWTVTRELLRRAAALDLARLEIPEAYGGLGLDKISAAYVAEQIAVNPSFAGSLGAHTSIGTLPIVYFGNDEQKGRYLPRLASAELVGAYALTEPESGSDALAARTTARLTADGRHYVLNGQKMWITNGAFADLFTIFAKVDGERFTAFIVERGMGVMSGRDEIKLGLDGSSTTALLLDNVHVPIENVLGPIGQGHKVAFNILNLGRVKLGTRNITGAKTALNQAVRYAGERRQFGRPISSFGLIKQKLAEMAVRCYVGDAMVYRALGDIDRALASVPHDDAGRVLKTIEGFAVECSVNKVWTSEALAYAVDEAVQVYGGNGYSREFPAERAYRDARITRIYEGTNEINRLIVPTRLLKQSPELFTVARAVEAAANLKLAADLEARATPRHFVAAAKGLAIAALGYAANGYGDSLKDEQEILAHIADMVIEAYAVESVLARADKLATLRPERDGLARDMAHVYASDSVGRVAHAAKQVVAALEARGIDAPGLAEAVRSIAMLPAIDTVAARRRIADAIINDGRYPF